MVFRDEQGIKSFQTRGTLRYLQRFLNSKIAEEDDFLRVLQKEINIKLEKQEKRNWAKEVKTKLEKENDLNFLSLEDHFTLILFSSTLAISNSAILFRFNAIIILEQCSVQSILLSSGVQSIRILI